MKRKITLLALTLITFYSYAQTETNSTEHMNFKGVPIDGTLKEFVNKMVQAGFKLISTEEGTTILNGDFAGYKDCYIGVSTLKQKDLVYKIGVFFPNLETWSLLSGNYFNLKQMLTEKYGTPSDVVEEFDVPSYSQPKDDQDKMYQVQFDNCKYYSIWQTDKGEIQLLISHSGVTNCFVLLFYFDKINNQTIMNQAIDDL
jgi:hypothetical protein